MPVAAYISLVAYDIELADRIRELISAEAGVSETKMFGGLAFLINGHMTIASSGQGGALVRVDPSRTEALTGTGQAEVAVMSGREMPGWLRVESGQLRTKRQLGSWIKIALAYTQSLPPKSAKKPKRGAG